MTPLFRKILGINWLMVLVTYALLIFGFFAIESAARHLNVSHTDDPGAFFAGRQRLWMVIGSVVYFVTALIDYRWVKWLCIPMYLGGLGMLVYLMAQGDGVHQLEFGGIAFQPTQFMIAAGIILLGVSGQYLPKVHRWIDASLRIILVALISGIPFLLVVKNGDMGSAIVWIPVAVVSLIASGVPFRYLSFLGLIAAGFLPILFYIVLPLVSERGAERIDSFVAILQGAELDRQDRDYAAYWVSTAVGVAGWKGLGWKAPPETGGIHAKGMVPKDTAHNDYIFAVIAEEFGFRGSFLLISAFSFLLILCLIAGFYSRDFCGQIIACGVVALFLAHIFENIGMCILIMPITGIPLPLISYSGTFVLICMFLLGLVQSIWVHRRYRIHDDDVKESRNRRFKPVLPK